MKASLQIDEKQIDDMDLEISMTMRVSEWRDMMRQLPKEWPSWRVSSLISHALGHIRQATETRLDLQP